MANNCEDCPIKQECCDNIGFLGSSPEAHRQNAARYPFFFPNGRTTYIYNPQTDDLDPVPVYSCKLHNRQTGRCEDYVNRPDICRNTGTPEHGYFNDRCRRHLTSSNAPLRSLFGIINRRPGR